MRLWFRLPRFASMDWHARRTSCLGLAYAPCSMTPGQPPQSDRSDSDSPWVVFGSQGSSRELPTCSSCRAVPWRPSTVGPSVRGSVKERSQSEYLAVLAGKKERERYRYREIEKAERYTPPNSDENPLNIEPGTSGSSMVICSWLTPFHALLEGGLYHKVSSVFD